MKEELFSQSMNTKKKVLTQGVLFLEKVAGNYSLESLIELAERRNPKRAFLFVSKILGKHIPVAPHKMRQSYQVLSAQLPTFIPGKTLFLGMAETAVGLAAGVFDETIKSCDEAILLLSTRHQLEAPLLCRFKENHSHASDHLIHLPLHNQVQSLFSDIQTFILIDDEVTTGNTLKNLLAALIATGEFPKLQKVYALTLTHWSDKEIKGGILPIEAKSLLFGCWEWQADTQAVPPKMPKVNAIDAGTQPIVGTQDWGRLGRFKLKNDNNDNIHQYLILSHWLSKVSFPLSARVLVLGTEEFLWPPFLFAESLEQRGYEVYFSSTTRSPIAEGGAIHSVISFADNYGQGISHYLYNVVHQSFDYIFLCIETPKESVDSTLLQTLVKVAQHVEILIYTEC